MYCGHSFQDANHVFAFYAYQNSTGNNYHFVYNFLYTPVPSTEDRINITYSSAGLNGDIFAGLKTGMIDAITNHSPYIVTVDNAQLPWVFTLTSVSDSNFIIAAAY
jgi:hypothetical protein